MGGRCENPYVRDKYHELWAALRSAPHRYMLLCRKELLADETLDAMRADGVEVEPTGDACDEYIRLLTTDYDVARKYGMHDESEFLREDDV